MLKKTITLLCIILYSFLLSAQKDSSKFIFMQFFFDNNQVSSEGYFRDGKPDGYWKTYYENGILKSEGNRKNYLLDSLWKFYDSEGNLTLEINYKENKKHGKTVTHLKDEIIVENFENNVKQGYTYYYYKDGGLKKELLYINGLIEGYVKEYAQSGMPVTLYKYNRGYLVSREHINRYNTVGNKHGVWMEFHDNGEIKRTEEWRNGILNGFVKEFDNKGNLKNITKYVHGEIEKEVAELKQHEIRRDYYSDGSIRIIGSYYNDLPDGIRREYDEHGNIIKGYIFAEGIMVGEGITDNMGFKQGLFREYFENGQLRSEGEYKNSKPVGEWKYYYPNGIIEQTGVYDNKGRRTGKWICYYNNGNIWKTENYINGILEGKYTEQDIDGKIIVKGEFFDGLEHEKWVWEIGDVIEEGSFSYGKYHGNWKINATETEKIIFTGRFLEGYPDGKHTYFWANGNKRIEGHFVMGKRHRDWFFYREDGSLFLRVTYRNGIEIRYDNVEIKPAIEEYQE